MKKNKKSANWKFNIDFNPNSWVNILLKKSLFFPAWCVVLLPSRAKKITDFVPSLKFQWYWYHLYCLISPRWYFTVQVIFLVKKREEMGDIFDLGDIIWVIFSKWVILFGWYFPNGWYYLGDIIDLGDIFDMGDIIWVIFSKWVILLIWVIFCKWVILFGWHFPNGWYYWFGWYFSSGWYYLGDIFDMGDIIWVIFWFGWYF